MKLTRGSLMETIRQVISPHPESEIDPATLKQMARGIMTTRPDEIDCAECFEQVDQFVELTLAGKDAAEALPLVEDHLNRCRGCREEFEALLAAVRSFA
ncbi:hypothetical protein ACFLWA_01195 [Chloroflexota bacterium]